MKRQDMNCKYLDSRNNIDNIVKIVINNSYQEFNFKKSKKSFKKLI